MPFSFWATDAEAEGNSSLLTKEDLELGGLSQDDLVEHMKAKGLVSLFANHEQVAAALVGESGLSPQQVVGMIASYDSYADLAQAVEGKQLQPPEAHVVEPTVTQERRSGLLSLFGQGPAQKDAELLRPQSAPTARYEYDADGHMSEILVTEPLPQPAASAMPGQMLDGAPADINDSLLSVRQGNPLADKPSSKDHMRVLAESLQRRRQAIAGGQQPEVGEGAHSSAPPTAVSAEGDVGLERSEREGPTSARSPEVSASPDQPITGRPPVSWLNELQATLKARGESGKVKVAVRAGKAAVTATPTAPRRPVPEARPVPEPAASAPPPAPAVHDAPEVVPPQPIPVSFWAQDGSGKGLTLERATSAIASGFSGKDTHRVQLRSYVEKQAAAFLQGRSNASSVQSSLLDKLGFPPAGQNWKSTREHTQFAETLALIRTPRQLEAAVNGRFDARLQQRCNAVALGKVEQQKDGWQYVTRCELLSLVDEAAMRYGRGDVYAITANPNDPLSPMKEHQDVAWVKVKIDGTEIDVPADCKTIAAYMSHAKNVLGDGAWTPENQQKAFAHAMVCVTADRGQKLGTDYADVCQHYVDTAGDKPWVMTPEMRHQLGVNEQFAVDAAKRDAFEQMHTHLSCCFAKTLDDVDYGGEAAGLKEGGSGLPVEKLKRYPQFQEQMWQQFWREFGQGKVKYLEDKEGRPVVKCGADGAAVVYVGQKDFMSVTAQGGQKSNGIKSDAEAEALVLGILRQRKIQGTGNRKPLVAYGKRTKDILRIVKACLNHGLPVRLGSDAASQRALKKLSLEDRQTVEGHMAYRDVQGRASSGTGGATPVQKAITDPNAAAPGQPPVPVQ